MIRIAFVTQLFLFGGGRSFDHLFLDREVVLVVLFAEDGAVFGAGADHLLLVMMVICRLEVELASGGTCCTVVPSM